MIDTFCLNGRVGDIGIKDKTIEVKLVFPNDERTQDELAYIFPIKKGLATVRIFSAVNRGYQPGRRRQATDELGTPTLPGVDMREECHGCGKMVDTANQPFYAKKGTEGEKEIILCELCYQVPQPETINPPPAAEAEIKTATCAVCRNYKQPGEGQTEGACTVHSGDPVAAYKKPDMAACEKFLALEVVKGGEAEAAPPETSAPETPPPVEGEAAPAAEEKPPDTGAEG